MLGWILKAVSLIPSGWKVIKFVGVVKDIEKLAKESIELINDLRNTLQALGDRGKELLRQVDDVTEAAANICQRLPGLRETENKLRNLIK